MTYRIYVPDDLHGDPVLDAMRRRFVGRNVYGFGGVAAGCAPRWLNFYAADAAFVVRDVVRDRKRVAALATGTTTAWSPAATTRYFALDPLRFIVTLPTVKPYGSNYDPGQPAGRCPALRLADWQVDRMITTSRPPPLRFGDPPGRLHDVHTGESRAEVAWRLGYPTGFDTMQALRTARTWRYDRVPLENFSVVFRRDRVIAVTDRSIHLP